MAARRKRDLLSSRRRVEDDGEDDDGAGDLADDSQSETSLLTADEELDADDTNSNHPDALSVQSLKANLEFETNQTGTVRRKRTKSKPSSRTVQPDLSAGLNGTPGFKTTTDVETMANGFKVDDNNEAEETLDFDESVPEDSADVATNADASSRHQPVQSRPTDSLAYKARREADPAFVPNRGGFFMHDQRTEGSHPSGVLSSRGRGRGRGFGPTGNMPGRNGIPASLPMDGKWNHDLHEYISEPLQHPPSHNDPNLSQQNSNMSTNSQNQGSTSTSRSTAIGTVAIKVFLPTMKEPITMSKKLTVRQHTKLPDLRPPLRRDKPVRISLPDHEPRYIFPSVERSFIFIPRAQRPNQQRNRSRNRGFFGQGHSRRTSIFGGGGGGSSYTPSVAMSRRSSQAQDGILSPTGSIYSRAPPGAPTGPSRPVVKLPMAPPSQRARSPSSGAITSSRGTPLVNLPQGSAYPLPSQPTFREHRSSQMTMYQPRPQKQVSVATIESPEQKGFQAPPQQEQQPFHHQVPLQFSQQGSGSEQAYYAQMGGLNFPNGSTPLSNIPEGAINAQPFQPGMGPQQGYYPYAMQQPMFYYAAAPAGPSGDPQMNQHQYGGSQVTSPMYLAQTPYFVPMLMPMQPGAEDPTGDGRAGMYAHESNGMVYYYDPSQVPENSGANTFAEASGGSIMPSGQEGYFGAPPNDVIYYPQQ